MQLSLTVYRLNFTIWRHAASSAAFFHVSMLILACPTYAIQLTPDYEMSEYYRQEMVYEKEDLMIDGPGKYPDYNFYRIAGLAIGGKDKGEAEGEDPPIDPWGLMP